MFLLSVNQHWRDVKICQEQDVRRAALVIIALCFAESTRRLSFRVIKRDRSCWNSFVNSKIVTGLSLRLGAFRAVLCSARHSRRRTDEALQLYLRGHLSAVIVGRCTCPVQGSGSAGGLECPVVLGATRRLISVSGRENVTKECRFVFIGFK